MVNLEQLLESRDRRAQRQRQLLEAYPACSLVCLTVQLPGPVKRNRSSLLIGGAGLAALLDKLGSVLRHVQVKDLETGYEAYLLVPLPALSVKQICCGIEESHPLGRLMDIDVLALGKQGVQMIPREALGLEPRKCLLCGNEVRYCMRAKTHTTAELLERIEQILKEYELQAPNPRTD